MIAVCLFGNCHHSLLISFRRNRIELNQARVDEMKPFSGSTLQTQPSQGGKKMFYNFKMRHMLFIACIAIAVLLSACSTKTLETPHGQLKVESLAYLRHGGSFYAKNPDRLVLTLTRLDKEMFSVDDLNYVIQSEAYLTDNHGKVYQIAEEFKGATISSSQTDKFRLEFSGKPPKGNRRFVLYWPDNNPLEIERDKHFQLDD
jgi:hypothetical protein